MTFDPSQLPDENREDIVTQAAIATAAWKFLGSFYGGDLGAAWTVMHSVFRLCLVQWWVNANRKSLESEGLSLEQVGRGSCPKRP